MDVFALVQHAAQPRVEGLALVGVGAARDDLLELVDQQHRLARIGRAEVTLRHRRPSLCQGLFERRERVRAGPHHRQDAVPLLPKHRQQAGLDDRRLARARGPADHQQHGITGLGTEFFDHPVAAIEQQPVFFVERGQPLERVALGRVEQVQPVARVQKDELALVVLLQGEEAGRLAQTLACTLTGLDGLRLHLVADVRIELGGGDDTVAFHVALGVGSAGQSVEQGLGKGRVIGVVFGRAARAGRLADTAHHVQRLLVTGRRGDHLPRRVGDEAVEALAVDLLRHEVAHRAVPARPLEGTREAAVQDQQQVAAGQRIERCLQVRHRDEGLQVGQFGVGRQDVAGRAVVAVG